MIEQRIGIPCAGVVPHLGHLDLDEEDSLALEHRPSPSSRYPSQNDAARPLRIAVIALPHLANFTDFDALAAEPAVSLAYARAPEELSSADLIILPGSKQTIEDLMWLRDRGFPSAIEQWQSRRDPRGFLIGICGGMQMLGLSVEDAAAVETGVVQSVSALGLLPIRTRLSARKVTRRATGTLASSPLALLPAKTPVSGYEIHLGETEYLPGASAFATILRHGKSDPLADGAVSHDGRVFGTYLHGLFDDDSFRHAFLKAARKHCRLSEPSPLAFVHAERDARISRLADHVRRSVDMSLIYRLLALRPHPLQSNQGASHSADPSIPIARGLRS